MNLTKKKQKEIRGFVLKKIPEVIEALKIKDEIIKILVDNVLENISKEEKYVIDNYPEVINFQFSEDKYYLRNKHNSIYLSGECDSGNSVIKPKYKRYRKYYSWETESNYDCEEVFELSEIYYEDFQKIYPNIPNTYEKNLSNLKEVISEDKLENLIIKIDKFNSLLVIAEKKLSKLNTILTSNLINLNDMRKNCPKLYKIIKDGK